MLTVSVNGYGKRTSSFEYRTTGRGGKGIVAMSVNDRNGKLVASFPVEDSDQIMLVTDKGQLIRCPVEGIRIAGRSTQGVIVFDTAEDEHVVSVEHIGEDTENGNGNAMANSALGGESSVNGHRLAAARHNRRGPRGASRGPRTRATGSLNSRLMACGRRSPGGLRGSWSWCRRRAGRTASKFGQACCEQSAPTGLDVEPVGLGEGYRHAGFDLRGKAGQNGKGGGNEGSDGDG